MTKEYPLLIGGEWQTSDERVEIRSPFNHEVIGTTFQATAEQISTAISSAAASAPQMAKMSSFQRAEILLRAADEVKTRAEELARMIALEAGKPIKAARIEAARAVTTLTIASEESKRVGGELIPLDRDAASQDRIAIMRRFPLGPIAAITPFNFPLNLVAHKLAPAAAVGNPVVLKPAPQTPLTSLVFGEILQRAGWPNGALSVLACSNEAAAPLITDTRVKMLSFTGSAAVGWHLRKLASDRRVVLELGGNAGVAVHSDADLDWAALRCALGSFNYAGQTCISIQRIYIHRPVYQDFLKRFLDKTAELKIGDPLDETVDIGPLISEKDAQRAETWVNEAIAAGAELLCGGTRTGSMMPPTVLTNVDAKMKVSCQEIFAPVVTLTAYDSFDEALTLIDDSAYGLQAGLFTRDMQAIFRAYERLNVGGLIVGDAPTYRADHMPYGGVKQSGLGREGLKYAIEEMTEMKTLVLKLT